MHKPVMVDSIQRIYYAQWYDSRLDKTCCSLSFSNSDFFYNFKAVSTQLIDVESFSETRRIYFWSGTEIVKSWLKSNFDYKIMDERKIVFYAPADLYKWKKKNMNFLHSFQNELKEINHIQDLL